MLWLLLACTSSSPELPPGILLVTIDTWRADHFSEDLSPEAWAVGEQGLVFQRAYSPIGLTTPAHASLFTGLQPPSHGVRGNNHHGYQLAESHTTLAEHLAAANWATGAFVSAYPAGPAGGLSQGFQVFDGPEAGERTAAETLEKARMWLTHQESPWFLWVHVYEPHGPYTPPSSAVRDHDPEGEKGAYAGEVRGVDRVLGPLYREALASGSWLAITSDHGEVLDEEPCHWQHERSSSDAVLRVPMVLAGPDIPTGQRDDPVGLMDLFPTVLQLAGVPDPGGHHGSSVLKISERTTWYGESGLCETDCSPGCSPSGFLGKDRVRFDSGERTVLRPGTRSSTDPAIQALFSDYPAPTLPEGPRDAEMGEALGYLDPR